MNPESNKLVANTGFKLFLLKLRHFTKVLTGMLVSYFIIYLFLSLNGQYRPMGFYQNDGVNMMGSELSWAPLAFFDQKHSPLGSVAYKKGLQIGHWRGGMMIMFYPLWYIDTSFLHKTVNSR